MKPPLQLQTTHGRRAQFANVGITTVVVLILVLASTDMPDSAKLFVALVTLGIVTVNNALRMRFSGLFLEDGRIVSRRLIFDRTTNEGPALASLSLRPWFGIHQVMASGDFPYGVPCMLRFGSLVPAALRNTPNELLVREAPVRGQRKRGRWEPTGIVWTDDDEGFLSEFTDYIDTALGTNPSAAPAGAPITSAASAAARALREASYPEFRTTHSFAKRPAASILVLAVGCTIFGFGCMVYGFASGAVASGDIRMITGGIVPAGFGVAVLAFAWSLRRGAIDLSTFVPPPNSGSQLLMTGVLVKHGRLLTGSTFVTPSTLTIAERRGTSTVAAVSTRGKTSRLSMLSHSPVRLESNELLVRYPKAHQPSAGTWQGTGIFWGTDGAAVIAHLEQALQLSRQQPGDGDLRSAA